MEAFERVPPKQWWWPIVIGSLVEKDYRGKPMSPVCLVCGEKPGRTGLTPDALCPICGRLLDWFRGHYADEGLDLTKLTAETTFRDISADSLEDVEWLVEAEEKFGVVIPDADAARMKTVGDYLGDLRLSMGGARPSPGQLSGMPSELDPMWDRQIDT
jgi:acyl carrier protein